MTKHIVVKQRSTECYYLFQLEDIRSYYDSPDGVRLQVDKEGCDFGSILIDGSLSQFYSKLTQLGVV